jgi:hypothetical protein
MRSVLLAVLLLAPLTGCKKDSVLKDAADPEYRVGQRWSYWARPGEETSTFIIEKIESHPKWGTVVHVGLDNLKLQKDKKTVSAVIHLPFSREAIEKSKAKKVEDDANLPPFKPEYEKWKQAVDEGGGTLIRATIAEQLNAMEDK